jgi:hypothetical protein
MGSRCIIMAADAIGRRAIRYLALIVPLLLAGVLTSCGATAPAPSASTPVPTGPVVNMAGGWTGTLASSNFPTQTITLMVYQATNCVDGAWSSASSNWAGAISGYVNDVAYSGLVSFERTDAGGGKCAASGPIEGPVTGNTLHWTAASLTPIGACVGELPQSIVVDLQRQ